MPKKQKTLAIEMPPKGVRDIIFRLLTGDNYREVVIALINTDFLRVAMDFLRKVALAKMDNEKIDGNWYRRHFIREGMENAVLATNAGTNLKTITNAMQTGTKAVVLNTSLKSYDNTVKMINDLIASLSKDSEININMKIKVGKVEVELELTETLVVINALAAKRATIRGGAWSTAGKRVEKPLMNTFCRLFGVSGDHYEEVFKSKAQVEGFDREVDFYLCPPNAERAKCEVKLMGRGNPESADAVIARGSKVFVADKMSDANKAQMNKRKVLWVELHSDSRFKRFQSVLNDLRVPYDKSAIKNITPDRIKKLIREVVV